MDTISIGVKFEMLRRDRELGNIGLLMRREGVARVAPTGLVGSREMRGTQYRPLLVRGIKILYCIIEQLHGSGRPFTLDDVVARFRASSGLDNHEYDPLIRLYGGGFPIDGSIARISSSYRGEFVVSAPPAAVSPGVKAEECAGEGRAVSLGGFLDTLVAELRGEGRLSTARSYRSTLKTLESFVATRPGNRCGGRFDIGCVDGAFVGDYGRYLEGRGISAETAGFYMRVFRTVLKTAWGRGLCAYDDGWFAGVTTSVGKVGANSGQRSLGRDTVLRLRGLDLGGRPELALSRDLFMFGFYCKGMELRDVLSLTSGNISGEFLVYRRRQRGTEVRVRIGAETREIIGRYSRPGRSYLFPLLENREDGYFFTARNTVNRDLGTIGRMLGLGRPLTYSMNIYTWKSLSEDSNLSSSLIS